MSKEAMKLALEALEICEQHGYIPVRLTRDAITAIKQARSAPVQEPVAFNAGVPPLYPEMKDGETISVEYTNPPAAQKDIQRLSALVRAQQITIDKLEQARSAPVQEPVAYIRKDQLQKAAQPALRPCRSPYCECSVGQCSHPGFYDARGEPLPPAPPPECQTDAEKTAFAFGWWKALESVRQQPAQPEQEPVEYWTVANGWVSEQAEVPAAVWVEPDFWEHCNRVNCGTAYRLPAPGRQPLYASPPAQRTWVGLTDEELVNVMPDDDTPMSLGEAFSKFAELIEAKLKEKNNG